MMVSRDRRTNGRLAANIVSKCIEYNAAYLYYIILLLEVPFPQSGLRCWVAHAHSNPWRSQSCMLKIFSEASLELLECLDLSQSSKLTHRRSPSFHIAFGPFSSSRTRHWPWFKGLTFLQLMFVVPPMLDRPEQMTSLKWHLLRFKWNSKMKNESHNMKYNIFRYQCILH